MFRRLLLIALLLLLALISSEKDVCDMAVTFNKDGQINFVNIPSVSALGGANPYSITAWIYVDGYGTATDGETATFFSINYDPDVFGSSDYTGRSGIGLAVENKVGSTDAIWIYRDHTNSADSDDTAVLSYYANDVISTGAWYHVAVTWDESGFPSTDYEPTLYVNGVNQALTAADTYTISLSPFDEFSTTYPVIGGSYHEWTGDTGTADNYYFDGNVQDVRVYDRILSSDEVYEIHASRLIHDGIHGKVFHCPLDGAGGAANFGSLDSNDTIWDVWGANVGSIENTLNGLANTIQTHGGK